jgi:hypothetical protein
MGIEGTLKISENPKYTAIYREASAPDWEEWIRLHYLSAPEAPPPADADADADLADARETAALATYELPVVLRKPVHQPHLENFFNAVRGQGTLNCPADEAFRSEIAIFKACEAVYARKMVEITPDDLKI